MILFKFDELKVFWTPNYLMTHNIETIVHPIIYKLFLFSTINISSQYMRLTKKMHAYYANVDWL